jgi:HEAT repeat protein
MLRSRANEIPALVRQLGSRRENRVDAARARLSIIGARAVEHLIEALEGTNNRVRVHVMPLLAMIQDPRGREPLIAMLLDRQARLRRTAAMCLARFPSPDSVAALNRTLRRDTHEEVRVAAVRSLVEQYAAGEEQAICMALDVLVDARQPAAIRLAAFSLLRTLRASQRRSILERLKQDPNESVRRRAEELASGADDPGSLDEETVRGLLDELASADYASWNEAVRRLAACGVAAIQPLVAEMQRRAHDPEYCTRAGMALKAMGPRRARALAGALDTIEEPLPLQVLVEVVGALGDKSLIYRLKDVIERVADLARTDEPNGFDPTRRVRAKAHLELARVGSRVAIRDLRDALGDTERRVELEMLAAVELIGKREELAVLLEAYGTEDTFVRRKIRDAVRAIMKRERIRRNDRMFPTLGADQQRALKAILPPAPERGRRTGANARPRA